MSFVQAAECAGPVKSAKNVNFKIVKSEEWRKAEIAANRAAQKWIKVVFRVKIRAHLMQFLKKFSLRVLEKFFDF